MKHFVALAAAIILLLPPIAATGMVTELRVKLQDCSSRNSCQMIENVGACVTIGRVEDGWIVVSSGHHLRGGTFQSARILAHDGYRSAVLLGFELGDGADLSVWRVPNLDNWRAIPIAERNPVRGSRVRQYGQGPGRYVARNLSVVSCDELKMITSGPAIRGDSGAAIVESHSSRLIGVVSATDNTRTYAIPAGKICETVRKFCPQFRCRCRPTAPPPPLLTDLPPVPTPPVSSPPPRIEIDYDRLADVLIERIESDPRFRGAEGPPGPTGGTGPAGVAGRDGVDGQDGKDADLTDWKRRVVLIKDGQIVDDELFGIDEPIVIDVNNIVKRAADK